MGTSNHFERIQPLWQPNLWTYGCVRKNIFGQMEKHRADSGRGIILWYSLWCVCSSQIWFQMLAGMSHFILSPSSGGEWTQEGDGARGGAVGLTSACELFITVIDLHTPPSCWLLTFKWAGKKAKAVFHYLLREYESEVFVVFFINSESFVSSLFTWYGRKSDFVCLMLCLGFLADP